MLKNISDVSTFVSELSPGDTNKVVCSSKDCIYLENTYHTVISKRKICAVPGPFPPYKFHLRFIYLFICLFFQQGQRAMGITCSTDVARHYELSEVTPGKFRCSCKHLSPVFDTSKTRMTCYIHVWECPI